jgi:hypothetical protein
VADVEIRVPVEVRDGLERLAASKGFSLPVYLSRLAWPALTPAERAVESQRQWDAFTAWGGYSPTDEELAAAKADLERQFAQLRAEQ